MKNYELTDETKCLGSITLHRIRAVVDFGDVSAGDLGGWIESESNLDQSGNAWVYENARVYGNASVYGNAIVYGNARVSDDACVSGSASVYGTARVCGTASVSKNSDIIVISKIGSRNDTITFVKSKDSKILANTGCFFGTIDKFEKTVKKTHGENKHAQAYFLAIKLAKLRIDHDQNEEI